MDIKTIPTEFIIYDVPDHNNHKAILLDLINKIPANPYKEVSKTDWNLPKSFKRKYINYFYSNIAKNMMDQQKKYFKAKSWKIENGWFQQYQEKSSHCYHTHPEVSFTNVYFLELPDKQFKTFIQSGGKEYNYKAQEGQIITFPAHLLHKSKENGNLRKTVISFNSNFHY